MERMSVMITAMSLVRTSASALEENRRLKNKCRPKRFLNELDAPALIQRAIIVRAMRGWYQFAPHVRSRTQVIVPVQGDRAASAASPVSARSRTPAPLRDSARRRLGR